MRKMNAESLPHQVKMAAKLRLTPTPKGLGLGPRVRLSVIVGHPPGWENQLFP
jgi:hypothetical protein